MAEQTAMVTAPASPAQVAASDPARIQTLLTGAQGGMDDFMRGAAAAFGQTEVAPAPANQPLVPPMQQRQVRVAATDEELQPRGSQEWAAAKEAIRAKAIAATEAVWQAKLEAVAKPNVVELPEFKALGQRVTEFETKWKQAEEQRQKVERDFRVVALDKHPEWKATFGKQVEQAVATATAAISDPAMRQQVEQALRADPGQRAKLLEGVAVALTPWQQMGLMQANAEVAKVDLALVEARANADQTWQELEQRAGNKTQVNRNQLTGRFEAKLAEWQDPVKGMELLRTRPGDTPEVRQWNEGVQERLARARTVISGNADEDSYANVALYGAVGPDLVKDSLAKIAEINALKAELAALRQAAPNPGGGGNGQQPGGQPGAIPAGMDMGAAMLAGMRAGGVAFPGRRF